MWLLYSIGDLLSSGLEPKNQTQLNTCLTRRFFMSDFFARVQRIQDDSALRDLEKKIHYLIACLDNNGMLMDNTVYNVPTVAGDVMSDAMEVAQQL
jgi:hypothetical protein